MNHSDAKAKEKPNTPASLIPFILLTMIRKNKELKELKVIPKVFQKAFF